MAELRTGTVVAWHNLSPILAVFRIMPEPGSRFPDYEAGQYMALRREDCRLTRRVRGDDGVLRVVPDLDAEGRPKTGPVTHSYSISSPPFETREQGWLEFYVVLERSDEGYPGRLTESLFRMRPGEDDALRYVNRIVGDFTLAKRARGARSVLLLGTGTGLAPFVSMIRQLDRDAAEGKADDARFTLFHTNRTLEELAYHEELARIAEAQRFDFVYVPSVSRPTVRDLEDPTIGKGRANNLLRHVFELPSKEQADLDAARAAGHNDAALASAVDRAVKAVLPLAVTRPLLQRRLEPGETVVLTCGNPALMADIRAVAEGVGMRFEKEDW